MMPLTRPGILARVRKLLRKLVVVGALGVAASVLAMAGADLWVRAGAHGHVYAVEDAPAAPVALVLGAEVYGDGSPSPFLAARLELARQLLVAGKVRAILVSGDHREWAYNEPGAMFSWLLDHGVPTEKIVLDHAGFDTYDSCARAKRVFGVGAAIVVTQTYHIDRAVTVCRKLGIDASGVADDSVRVYTEPWYHSAARERGAVVKAVFDVASGRDPVFLGPHETGVEAALG
ncbi:ElyC/SanA/YdcF family protein [Actinoplanes sp. NPDC049548]|uniref:SanA/YdcF family protein n=1 Tax=Actinoplanes sp. NPDC049548 TaxID=3155152 RepID=UPI00343FE68B